MPVERVPPGKLAMTVTVRTSPLPLRDPQGAACAVSPLLDLDAWAGAGQHPSSQGAQKYSCVDRSWYVVVSRHTIESYVHTRAEGEIATVILGS